MLFVAINDKKALMAIMKENLRFKQLRLNYINNQKNQTKKEQLSTIKIYSYFSFVFSTVPKKVELLKISEMM